MSKKPGEQPVSRRNLLSRIVLVPAAALIGLVLGEGLNQVTRKNVSGSGRTGKHALWIGESEPSTTLGPSIVSEIASGVNTGLPAIVLPNKGWIHWADSAGGYGEVGSGGIQIDGGNNLNICNVRQGFFSIVDGFAGNTIMQAAKNGAIATSNNAAVLLPNATTLAWFKGGDMWPWGNGPFTANGANGITLGADDNFYWNIQKGQMLKLVDGQGGKNIVTFANSKFFGDFAGPVHASSFETSSDLRFKTSIQPLKNALEKVSQLNPVTFKWSKLYKESLKRNGGDESTHVGLIAQEVEKVIPEIVTKWEQDGVTDYRAIDYARLVPYLIESIKALKAKVEELDHKLEHRV